MTDGQSPDTPATAGVPLDTGPELRRDEEHRVLVGVCSGLGAYTGIDPVLWRAGFVLTVFAGGTGLLLYLAAWVLMRDPQGGPATFEQMLDRAIPSRAVPKMLAVGLMAATALSLVGGFGWGTMVLAIPLVLGVLTARNRGVDLRSSLSGLKADLAERKPPPTGPTPQPSAAYYNPAQPWASAPQGPVDLAVVSERTSLDVEDGGEDEDEDEERDHGRRRNGHSCASKRKPRSAALASHALWIVVTMAIVWAIIAPNLGPPFSELSSTSLLFGSEFGIYFMAAAIAVIGLFALIGAWVGDPRGLRFLGTLAVLGAVLVSTTDVTTWRVGEQVWRPLSIAEAESTEMRMDLGQGTLDLTRLGEALEPGQSVDVTARVGQGVLVVVVPADLRVELDGGVVFGAVRTPEGEEGEPYGYALTYEETFEPIGPVPSPEGAERDVTDDEGTTGSEEGPDRAEDAAVPTVNVDADARVGVLEVRYDQARN